jgi:hypothetical protein
MTTCWLISAAILLGQASPPASPDAKPTVSVLVRPPSAAAAAEQPSAPASTEPPPRTILVPVPPAAAPLAPLAPVDLIEGVPTPTRPPFAAGESNPVAPAAFTESRPPATATERSSLATSPASSPSALLISLLKTPTEQALPGERAALVDALARAGETRRRQAIAAYWNASLRLAEYHAALEDRALVLGLAVPPDAADPAAFLAALRAAAEARVRRAERDAVAAQYELAEAAHLPFDAAPPLPADEPLAGPYRTNFDALFAGRPAPATARRIDGTLPYTWRWIEAQAESFAQAEQAVRADTATAAAGHAALAGVASALRRRQEERTAFLESIRVYNSDIADYVLATVGASAAAETIVAALIGAQAEPPRSVLAPRGSVAPASVLVPIPRGPGSTATPAPAPAPTPAAPVPATNWEPRDGAIRRPAGS